MAVEVLRHVVGAAAGAQDKRALARPAGAAVEALGVHDRALEVVKPRDIRPHRVAADAIGADDVARPHDALGAVAALQRGHPVAGRFIPFGIGEFGIGPAVDLHRVGIELEPVPQHVLGDVGRPGRRERHVGQVVDVDGVVQRQGMVAPPPAVADARPLLHHQRVHPQLVQPGRHGQAGLRAAHHDHRGVVILVGAGAAAHVGPVLAAEIARIGRAARAVGADPLLMPVDGVQRGGEQPCLQRAVLGRGEPDDAGTAADGGVELMDRLDAFGAQPHDLARWPAVGRQGEGACGDAGLLGQQALGDGVLPGHRGHVPGEGQHIAPMRVRVEQSGQRCGVAGGQRGLERR